ncbi:hypothetical protein EST38_g11072 [Candolleomyces aberdarensis]|uniref:Uncharacterized protein n=1 Tax=Candolleomyces aberdarensis TaxID=2316362 RepID=A0A4Q2D5T2_9AGAR|nr:hypothetical protein EST38_g11072 [Candolleomyces aberdarensis]
MTLKIIPLLTRFETEEMPPVAQTTLSFKSKLQGLLGYRKAVDEHLPVPVPCHPHIPPLPQEIIDIIVDNVALSPLALSSPIQAEFTTSGTSTPLSSIQTLKTLSITSPIFLNRCRSHLFRRLRVSLKLGRRSRGKSNSTLQGAEANTYLLRTLDLFQKKPILATFVRKVEVVFDFGKVAATSHRWSAAWFGDADVEAVKKGQASLSRLFPMFQKLERLKLVHLSLGSSVDWSNGIEKDLRMALFRMIVLSSGGSLKSLTLVGFQDLPMEVLASLKALEHLEIPRSTSVRFPQNGEVGPLEMPWKLRSLSAACGLGVLDPSNGNGMYSRLRQLSLVIGTVDDHVVAWNIIGIAAQTLVALKLDYTPRADEPNLVREVQLPGRSVLPSSTPNLRFLSINISGQGESAHLGYPASVPPTIPALLSTFLDSLDLPSLEAFSAVTQFQLSFENYQLLDFSSTSNTATGGRGLINNREAGWNRLADILSDGLDRFPSLRAVRVVVDPEIRYPPGGVDFHDVMYELQDALIEKAAEETESALRKVRPTVELFDVGQNMKGSRFSEMVEDYWA